MSLRAGRPLLQGSEVRRSSLSSNGGRSTPTTSSNAPTPPPPLHDGTASSSSGLVPRALELIVWALKTKFISAPVKLVYDYWPEPLKMRSTKKGKNTELPAELPYLKDLQDHGILIVIVLATAQHRYFYLKKMKVEDMTDEQRQQLAKKMNLINVTMCEYASNAVEGAIEADPEKLHPKMQGKLPYYLKDTETPLFMLEAPAPTQERNRAEDELISTSSGSTNMQNDSGTISDIEGDEEDEADAATESEEANKSKRPRM